MPARNLTRGTVIAERVEVAGGLWAKLIGLMGRQSLAPGASLWLPDSNGIHMMFMRFPIDAIFLGKPAPGGSATRGAAGGPGATSGPGARGAEGATGDVPAGARRVISVHRALPAWTGLVPLVRGAHGCLELAAGAIDLSATQVGDLVAID